MTSFERGGMNRKLCTKDGGTCWSLHALWDSEILKLIESTIINQMQFPTSMMYFDIESWVRFLNSVLCKAYEFPNYYTIDDYKNKYSFISLFLARTAALHTAMLFNSKVYPHHRSDKMTSSFNSVSEFEREVSSNRFIVIKYIYF